MFQENSTLGGEGGGCEGNGLGLRFNRALRVMKPIIVFPGYYKKKNAGLIQRAKIDLTSVSLGCWVPARL